MMIEALSQIPIFGALSRDAIAYLLSVSTSIILESGEFLFNEGDSGDCLYLINKGAVGIRKINPEGQSMEVVCLGQGDTVGEMSIFDMCPRSASARGLERTELLCWRSTDLLELYHKDVEQFALLQMNIGREISRRLRRMDEQILQLMSQPASIVE